MVGFDGSTLPRVLAVDDSAVARAMYRELLTPNNGFELIATAPNADIARRKLTAMQPDILVLDIEMPGEDGLSLLRWVMKNHPLPVVVASSYSFRGAEQTLEAFSLGAVEVVCKTSVAVTDGSKGFDQALLGALAAAARVRRRTPRKPALAGSTPVPASAPSPVMHRRGTLVVIGASTGGTEVLGRLIGEMPADFPPTLVVQHMPPIYTRAFAGRLDTLGQVRVEEARDNQMIGTGHVLIAPGGKQMQVQPGAAGPVARIYDGVQVNHHAPSVDVLFQSAAQHYRGRTLGVLLTGMGNDGAAGLLAIREAGGMTIAQDEASSVVWGMPQEAIKLGAAQAVLPVERIITRIVTWLRRG